MKPIAGASQVTTGLGVCGNPFTLSGGASCILSILVNGSELGQPITNGPVVCDAQSPLQCYQPAPTNALQVMQAPAITDATISVSNSPLTLLTSLSGTLTITNNSLLVAATNITSNFSGTALDGKVSESGNTCSNVAPQGTCTITYTAGNSVVVATNFAIQGSNTNAATAAIQIDSNVDVTSIAPASGAIAGGLGVVLTGVAMSDVTGVTFDGVAATHMRVVNSTTVTAVSPRHATGAVDIRVTTSGGGSSTLANGFTYVANAPGLAAFGGKIGCLGGGLNNYIAASADNSASVQWGPTAPSTGASSTTDGAANTAAIIAKFGDNGGIPYAAKVCEDYEVDSQGNTPCEAGNACYDDWFLPAGGSPTAQIKCLYDNRVAIGGFEMSSFPSNYWSSTEVLSFGYTQRFVGGTVTNESKTNMYPIRCVRAFTP